MEIKLIDFLMIIILFLNYRESKKKLEELLSEWSKWHAAHCSSSKV